MSGGAPASALFFALDIDGTVILEDESLSPGVLDAVQGAVAAGHVVTLATGRSWESTGHILDRLGITPEYVVCSNGALVMKRIDDGYERYFAETFNAQEVLTMLREHLPEAHYLVELADGRRLYTDYLDDWNLSYATQVDFAVLAAEPVTRVVVVAPEQSEQDFLDLVRRIGLNEVSYAVGWTAWLDIAPMGVDKGTALARVCQWTATDPASVIVVGDGRNDIGMMQWARANGGRAVAMGQAPDEVREAAGEVTAAVADGGVAVLLAAVVRQIGDHSGQIALSPE